MKSDDTTNLKDQQLARDLNQYTPIAEKPSRRYLLPKFFQLQCEFASVLLKDGFLLCGFNCYETSKLSTTTSIQISNTPDISP